MKKAVAIAAALMIYLSVILLPDSGYAQQYPGYSYFWVRVLDASKNPISNAVVVARKTATGDSYTLTPLGWGYYNKTLEPGTYDIWVNGRVLRYSVYAGAFWYVMVRCYI